MCCTACNSTSTMSAEFHIVSYTVSIVYTVSVNIIRIHAFFISNAFFNPASVLLNFLMNWATTVAQVLLNACKDHHTETLSIFTIFVSMSKSRTIYVVSM